MGEIDLILRDGEVLISTVANYKYFISKNFQEESKGFTSYDLSTGLKIHEEKTKKELIQKMNDEELIYRVLKFLQSNFFTSPGGYIERYKNLLAKQLEVNQEENIKVDNLYIND